MKLTALKDHGIGDQFKSAGDPIDEPDEDRARQLIRNGVAEEHGAKAREAPDNKMAQEPDNKAKVAPQSKDITHQSAKR